MSPSRELRSAFWAEMPFTGPWLTSCVSSGTTEIQGHRQGLRARLRGHRTPSTPDANLDCTLVLNALVFISLLSFSKGNIKLDIHFQRINLDSFAFTKTTMMQGIEVVLSGENCVFCDYIGQQHDHTSCVWVEYDLTWLGDNYLVLLSPLTGNLKDLSGSDGSAPRRSPMRHDYVSSHACTCSTITGK